METQRFFGIQYYSINSTVSYCNISKGGMKLEKIIKLDSEYRKKWFGFLQPKTFLLNAGTNDRIDTNVQQFKKQINQYITYVKSGSPDTKMIFIEPNQPEDYLTTNAIYFEKARKTTTTKHQLKLIDIPKTIGNHRFFVDDKLKIDAIHPNKEGFERIALEVDKQL
jgi:lysophospholipase L1-like esterase